MEKKYADDAWTLAYNLVGRALTHLPKIESGMEVPIRVGDFEYEKTGITYNGFAIMRDGIESGILFQPYRPRKAANFTQLYYVNDNTKHSLSANKLQTEDEEDKDYPHFVSTWEKGKRGYKNARLTYFRVDFSNGAWAYYSGRELKGHKFGNWQTVEFLPDSLEGKHYIAGHNIADKINFEENALGILRQSGLEAFVLELERNSK